MDKEFLLNMDRGPDMQINRYRGNRVDKSKRIEVSVAKGVAKGVDKGVSKGVAKGVDKGVDRGVDKGVAKGVDRGISLCLLGFVFLMAFTAACRTGKSPKIETGSSGPGATKEATTTSTKDFSEDSTKNYTEDSSQESTGTDGGSQKRAQWNEDLSNTAQATESSTGKATKLDFSKRKNKKLALLQDQFSSRLKSAVKNKNKKELFSFLDPDYVKTQLKGLLKGRVDQFLNELFCGKDSAGKFHCLKWQQIQKVVEIRVGWQGDAAKVMQVVVTNGKVTVTVEFSLVPTSSTTTFPYRFRGGVG